MAELRGEPIGTGEKNLFETVPENLAELKAAIDDIEKKQIRHTGALKNILGHAEKFFPGDEHAQYIYFRWYASTYDGHRQFTNLALTEAEKEANSTVLRKIQKKVNLKRTL